MKADKFHAAKILGKLGGKSTLKKYGNEHFKKAIDKRWDKYREAKKANENGPEEDLSTPTT